jgi:serine/threonine-protein kinase
VNREDYRRVCEIFDAVWALPAEEREANLANLCAADTELYARVHKLLAHAASADRDGFLAGTSDAVASCSSLRPTQAAAAPRFQPGEVIASRYQVTMRLGVGGMGEVYRAEDLMLGQTVALKFLSRAHSGDSRPLNTLLREVRLGREVAHPHVCRVYDVSEAGGDRFISMEYIDGEDLATKLHRNGPLDPQAARRIAQQVCLGLAALHQRGMVHRDLKPGNVMLDRQQRARIVDFGLAVAAGSKPAEVAGTLGYVAPECLCGESPTPRSDLYSFGRLLEKLFPTSNGRIDPQIKAVIARCLAEDPARRPASALEVARALGWDPLEEARAAGRLLSPVEVADASGEAPISPRMARLALFVVIAGMLLIMQGHTQTSAFPRVGPLAPGELTQRARGILHRLGYTAAPVDRAWSYRLSPSYRGGLSPGVGFWYRESPHELVPRLFQREGGWRNWGTANVSFEDPPLDRQGECLLVLDAASGHLRELLCRPAALNAAAMGGFSALFADAGLKQADFGSPTSGNLHDARVPCERMLTWESLPGVSPRLIVTAAELARTPVMFQVRRAEETSDDAGFLAPSSELGWSFFASDLLLIALMVAAAWLAPRNLRQGYADRRGAMRVAAVMFILRCADWLVSAHHVSQQAELDLFVMGAARALFDAALMWLFYIALEPAVRRFWPETLVSWNRLLDGRWRDPLVAGSILAGLALGVVSELFDQLDILASQWLAPERARLTSFWSLPDARPATIVSSLLSLLPWGVSMPMFGLLMLLLFRMLLRSQVLAAAAFALFTWALYIRHQGVAELNWVAISITSVLLVFLFTRLGLLGAVAFWLVHLLAILPLSLDPRAWWLPMSYSVLALVSLLAVYGYYHSGKALREPSAAD